MKAAVCKRYKFSAAHHLPGHPGACSSVHGHTFWADVYAEGELDEAGMVVDYDVLSTAWEEIEPELDHADLNVILPVPTTEYVAAYIAHWMHDRIPQVTKVVVWEGPGQFAEVKV